MNAASTAVDWQITGFADTVPIIREATVKAVYPLAGKVRRFPIT